MVERSAPAPASALRSHRPTGFDSHRVASPDARALCGQRDGRVLHAKWIEDACLHQLLVTQSGPPRQRDTEQPGPRFEYSHCVPGSRNS